jgi:hypothetical protein
MEVMNANAQKLKQSTLVSSSEWMIEKQMKQKDLNPSVAKFCAGLLVYRLKEKINDDWEILQQNGREYFLWLAQTQQRNKAMTL